MQQVPIHEHQECALRAANLPGDGKVDAGNLNPAMWAASTRPGCAAPSSSDLFGDRSIEGGLRKVEGWLQDGGDDGCLQEIVDAFHPDPGELEAALAETERIHQRDHHDAVREIEDRERHRFRDQTPGRTHSSQQ